MCVKFRGPELRSCPDQRLQTSYASDFGKASWTRLDNRFMIWKSAKIRRASSSFCSASAFLYAHSRTSVSNSCPLLPEFRFYQAPLPQVALR